MKKYFLFLFLVCWSKFSYSYVHNQTKTSIPLHWSSSSSVVNIYVNPENSQGLTEASVHSIALSSINEWNGISNITINKNTTTSKGQDDLNVLYFSNDPSIFNGSGVIGVTLVRFQESSGQITSADILISDSEFFSSTRTSIKYLGNVIAHEIGHFLGLGHGQVAGSTMFYALSKGQGQLSDDDKAGLYSTYPTGDISKGVLKGTIVGGKNLTAVFGTHVQAISVKTGKVMGAAISELNGKFSINGLPRNDQYLIYTSPLKQLGLPTNYANARSDFCEASTKYRGSFFQSCAASSVGFPEAVSLNSSLVDIGNISIRCGLDNPPEYIQNKNSSSTSFDLNNYTSSGLGGSFVGFFSDREMLQSITPGLVHDYFKINFGDILDWDDVDTSANLYMELKVTNQAFYSSLKAEVSIKRGATSVEVTPAPSTYSAESDGRVNIDTVTRVPINRLVPSDNNFQIVISPRPIIAEEIANDIIDFSQIETGIPPSRSDLFPSYSLLQENLYFYLVTATIVKGNGDGTFAQVASKKDLLSDNSMCSDAVNTYALTNYSVTGISSSPNRNKTAGCGIVVDESNGPGGGGGPGGFMIGLIFCFIISYALTRYSKLT